MDYIIDILDISWIYVDMEVQASSSPFPLDLELIRNSVKGEIPESCCSRAPGWISTGGLTVCELNNYMF